MPSVFEQKKLALAISVALVGSPIAVADDVVSDLDIDDSRSQSQEVEQNVTATDTEEVIVEQSEAVASGKSAAGEN